MQTVPPANEPASAGLRPARGGTHVEWDENVLLGYILLPDTELTSVRVSLNGTPAGSGPVVASRPDIAKFYHHIPHALRSGFRVALKPGSLRTAEINRFTVVGFHNETPAAVLRTLEVAKDLVPVTPTPPPELIRRIQGGHDGELYRSLGFRYYRQLRDVLARHRDPRSVRRLLDWGCACGRVAVHFLAEPGGPEVFGCDIDPDTIDWCAANLRGGRFTRIDPEAPLPYEDARFDVITSLAVLASFGPEAYARSLPELRRVLAPGGLLLASVQGAFTAAFECPPEILTALRRDGICDGGQYEPAEKSLERGEWRGFFLTREYVYREWSKYFEVLEYLEGEINADEDLVVVQRPA